MKRFIVTAAMVGILTLNVYANALIPLRPFTLTETEEENKVGTFPRPTYDTNVEGKHYSAFQLDVNYNWGGSSGSRKSGTSDSGTTSGSGGGSVNTDNIQVADITTSSELYKPTEDEIRVVKAVLEGAPWVEPEKNITQCAWLLNECGFNYTYGFAHAMGQFRAETTWGVHTEEWYKKGPPIELSQDQKDYEFKKNLGNTEVGDGMRFMGAGYIQLTGRWNYQAFSDYIQDPNVMQGTKYVAANYPWEASAFYWKIQRPTIIPVMNDNGNFDLITEAVNNGKAGLEVRQEGFVKVCGILGIDPLIVY